MAIAPETQYPGKIAPATPAYPFGAARNITVPGDGTGTPWEQALVNDIFGFQQRLLTLAGLTPTGTPDTAENSQYYSALQALGVFEYDPDRTYGSGEWAFTTEAVYQSLTPSNQGNDPDTDGGTNWGALATAADLAKKQDKPSETSVSGSATFTNATNNIGLTGVGTIGLEIGDVIEVTGSANNDKLFTVEVITDDDNVIVNQAHAGGTTTKALIDETVSVTVTLKCKWFLAPLGLGQGWVDVTSARAYDTPYQNPTNRTIKSMCEMAGGNFQYVMTVDGVASWSFNSETDVAGTVGGEIPRDSIYRVTGRNVIQIWTELR